MENSIELIKSRLDKVTPGKWEWEWEFDNESTMPILKSCVKEIMDFGESETYYPSEGTPPNKHDAEFIVNAKSDIEYLIEKCERYGKALNEIAYEKILSQYTNVIDMAVDFKKIAQGAFKKNEQTK